MEDIEEKDVKVKMSICPECGNAINVWVLHSMTEDNKKEFMKEVSTHNLDVKTISLNDYRNSNIELFCKETCSNK